MPRFGREVGGLFESAPVKVPAGGMTVDDASRPACATHCGADDGAFPFAVGSDEQEGSATVDTMKNTGDDILGKDGAIAARHVEGEKVQRERQE